MTSPSRLLSRIPSLFAFWRWPKRALALALIVTYFTAPVSAIHLLWHSKCYMIADVATKTVFWPALAIAKRFSAVGAIYDWQFGLMDRVIGSSGWGMKFGPPGPAVPVPAPVSQRIIHVFDLHYATRDDFAADLHDQHPEGIEEAEVDRRYTDFLNQVEAVQTEQLAILRGLIREYGIRNVFVEGLTDANVERFRATVRELPDVEIPYLQRQMLETDDIAEQALLLATIEEHRAKRLEVGAVGFLLQSGELDLLPLEDPELMAAADPRQNRFRLDGPENAARERDMVRRLLAGGWVVVVVLGSKHDLLDEFRKADPKAFYFGIRPEALKP